IKLSEKFMPNGKPSAELLTRLIELANDPAMTVRYQLAFTLGEIKGPAKIQPLAMIARRDAESSWTQAAILSSLAEGAGDLFTAVAADKNFALSSGGKDFLRQLVTLVAARKNAEELNRVADFIKGVQQPELSFALVRALGDGLKRAGGPPTIVEEKLGHILREAAASVDDAKNPES